MHYKAIVATTHVDRHGTRFAKEALETAVAQAKDETVTIPMLLAHDRLVPPIGKIVDAWVEPRDDGEFQQVAICELFENVFEGTLPGGTKLIKLASPNDNRPFINLYANASQHFQITVDKVNFESDQNHAEFMENLREIGEFDALVFNRKSVLPPPEVVLAVCETLVLYFLTQTSKKTIDKASDKLSESISNDIVTFYRLVKGIVMNSPRYLLPRSEPKTYIFVLPGSPTIELTARTNDAEMVLSSVRIERILPLVEKALDLTAIFDIDKVQFTLNPEGEWVLNYLLTQKGEVV